MGSWEAGKAGGDGKLGFRGSSCPALLPGRGSRWEEQHQELDVGKAAPSGVAQVGDGGKLCSATIKQEIDDEKRLNIYFCISSRLLDKSSGFLPRKGKIPALLLQTPEHPPILLNSLMPTYFVLTAIQMLTAAVHVRQKAA